MYIRNFKILTMNREQIFDRMADEIVDKVLDNMIEQETMESTKDEDYIDEVEFLMCSFTFMDSNEGDDYWEKYISNLLILDLMLSECLNDE